MMQKPTRMDGEGRVLTQVGTPSRADCLGAAIDPSGVEQGVQATVGLAHLGHQAGDTAGISHVEPHGPAALPEQRSCLLGALQVGAGDAGAFLASWVAMAAPVPEPAPVTMAT
jgi:hypothetical protein